MDIIIGGVYQGKLDYAKAQFSLTDSDVFFCSECPVLDLTKRCIYGFEHTCGLVRKAASCRRRNIRRKRC